MYELTNTAYKYIEIGNGSTATHVELNSTFIHWGGSTPSSVSDAPEFGGTTRIENVRMTNNGHFYFGQKFTNGSATYYYSKAKFISRNAYANSSVIAAKNHAIFFVQAGGNFYGWGARAMTKDGSCIVSLGLDAATSYYELRGDTAFLNTAQIRDFSTSKVLAGGIFPKSDGVNANGYTPKAFYATLVEKLNLVGSNIGISVVGASKNLKLHFRECVFGNSDSNAGDIWWRGQSATNPVSFYNDDPVVLDSGEGKTEVTYKTYQVAENNAYERRTVALKYSGYFSGLYPSVEIRDKNNGTTYADGTSMVSEQTQTNGTLGAAVTGSTYSWQNRTAGQIPLIRYKLPYNNTAGYVAVTPEYMGDYSHKVVAPFMQKQSNAITLTNSKFSTTYTLLEDIYVAPGQTRNSTLWTTISGYSTKFAINYGSSTFTVTSGTQQEAYDYDHYVNSQLSNIQQTKFFTTTNGTDFTLRTGTTLINFQNLTQGATRIAGGTIRYSATGTYTPRLGVITVDFSQAGTYNFAGADFGGQVTFTNSSGGNVTVELETGVDYINSGPNITISEPQVYQSATISGLTAGTRIQLYDLTSDTQLYNGTPTFPYTWTDPSPYAADREIRLRASYVSGTSAKEFIEATIGTVTETSPSISYLANQSDDAVYNANGINGSTVTGITFTDAATDLVNINISAGSVTWQSIYAAFVYWMFTATGIADDIAYVDAVDPANYRLTSMKIKNTSSPMVPLEITGGYGVDNTTGASIDLVDTTGGTLVFAPDHVVNNIVTVGGANIITGDIDDVTAKVQAGLTAQGYTTTRAPKLDNLDVAVSTAGGATASEVWSHSTRTLSTAGVTAIQSGLATEANATKNKNTILGEF